MTTGIVTFDFTAWITRYPEFAAVPAPTAQIYFDEATLYCDNTAKSRVKDTTQRAVLLNMLTAHIAKLAAMAAASAAASGSLVGQVTSASEGSVSVSVAAMGQGDAPGADWFNQTPYGAAFWRASATYRTARYHRGRTPYLGVGASSLPRVWGV